MYIPINLGNVKLIYLLFTCSVPKVVFMKVSNTILYTIQRKIDPVRSTGHSEQYSRLKKGTQSTYFDFKQFLIFILF